MIALQTYYHLNYHCGQPRIQNPDGFWVCRVCGLVVADPDYDPSSLVLPATTEYQQTPLTNFVHTEPLPQRKTLKNWDRQALIDRHWHRLAMIDIQHYSKQATMTDRIRTIATRLIKTLELPIRLVDDVVIRWWAIQKTGQYIPNQTALAVGLLWVTLKSEAQGITFKQLVELAQTFGHKCNATIMQRALIQFNIKIPPTTIHAYFPKILSNLRQQIPADRYALIGMSPDQYHRALEDTLARIVPYFLRHHPPIYNLYYTAGALVYAAANRLDPHRRRGIFLTQSYLAHAMCVTEYQIRDAYIRSVKPCVRRRRGQ